LSNRALWPASKARTTTVPCASPKFCPALKSTAYTFSSAPEPAMTVAHILLRGIMVASAYPLLAIA
jgi:hypothetical protein